MASIHRSSPPPHSLDKNSLDEGVLHRLQQRLKFVRRETWTSSLSVHVFVKVERSGRIQWVFSLKIDIIWVDLHANYIIVYHLWCMLGDNV